MCHRCIIKGNKNMKREIIKRIGKIAYMKFFDGNGNIDLSKYKYYIGKNGRGYDCVKLFWGIHWIQRTNFGQQLK